jgi:HEAT repeat protein
MLPLMNVVRLTAVAVVLPVTACGPSANSGGFDSAVPAAKIAAIHDAQQKNDPADIKRLVEQLDSDDPAVRLAAISTLQRLTGQTLGYRHFDPPAQRDAAVQRWVEAVKAGSVTIQPQAGTDAGAKTPVTSALEHADHDGQSTEERHG